MRLSPDTEAQLRERVKELTCLYGIARIAARPDIPLETVLRDIVELVPRAWLHPHIASARILLDGRSYSIPGFREGPCRQAASIAVAGRTRGAIEVVYAEERPEMDEGPFLREERKLIDAVAAQVASILEHREATEEKAKLQDQLRHADRLATIGQLAAGVAHELNEPLGAILGFAGLAKKCEGLPRQAKEDIEKIEASSLHARDIIKKLLVFGRQVPPRKTRVDLNRVVEEAISFFAARCIEEDVELALRLSPDLPAVTGDGGQLHQVLVNLVVNALQAMPDGGKLTVETGAGEGDVLLAVEDTGIGMSEETIGKLFVPFFTTKDIGEGTGLGLPVAYGIVASHGGSIRVKSALGRGSRFEIALPPAGRGRPDPEPWPAGGEAERKDATGNVAG
jgi:two-component system NtrC family sensor kinase